MLETNPQSDNPMWAGFGDGGKKEINLTEKYCQWK